MQLVPIGAGFRIVVLYCVITPCVAQVSRAFAAIGGTPGGPAPTKACGVSWWSNPACWERCTGPSTCCACLTAGPDSICSYCPAGSHCVGLDACCPDGKKACEGGLTGLLCAPDDYTCYPDKGIACQPGAVPCGKVCCPIGFVCGPGPQCLPPDQLCDGVPCWGGRCQNKQCCPAAQQCGETDCCAPQQWCLDNKCIDCPYAQRCNNGLCCTATQQCVIAVSQGVLDWACCEKEDVCGGQACCRDSACCNGRCCESGKTQCCKDREACCQKDETCCGGEEACCKPDESCCKVPPLVPPATNDTVAVAQSECFAGKPLPAAASPTFRLDSMVSAATAASSIVDADSITRTMPNALVRFESWPVGQGEANIIVCQGTANASSAEAVVIDLGTRGGLSWTAATIKARLLPLNPRVVIVSHPDVDHYSYLPDVFNDAVLPLRAVLLGGSRAAYDADMQAWLDMVEGRHQVTVRMLNGGQRCLGNDECGVTDILASVCPFNQPPVNVEVLMANLNNGNSNTDSAIVKVTHGSTTMLFPGDFENATPAASGAQDIAIHFLGAMLASSVYKVAHHGASRLANYGQFLLAIHPQVAIFSSAFPTSQYHHPRCHVWHNLLYSARSLLLLHPQDWPAGFACSYEENDAIHIQRQGDGPCHALYSTTPAEDRIATVVVYSSGSAFYVDQQLYYASGNVVDLEVSAPSHTLAVQ